MASTQNLVKRKFSWIYTFYHEVPVVINALRDITVGVYGHLEITSKIDLDISIKYTERILRGLALKYFDRYFWLAKR